MLGLHSLFNALVGRSEHKKPRSESPLYKAVKQGNVMEVKRLLRNGANPNDSNAQNLTALHMAAYWGETEIVELLLKHGARADVDNGKGWTALHSAAISGGLKSRKNIIAMLLTAGAALHKPDQHGWTAQDYMQLWENNAAAAEKLKQYLGLSEGQKPPAHSVPGSSKAPALWH